MYIIELGNGTLQYVASANETEKNLQFIEMMRSYTLQRHGADVLVYNKKKQLVSLIKPYDNTQHLFINDFELAAAFGAKRFIEGEALAYYSREDFKMHQVMQFERDRNFPLVKDEDPKKQNFLTLQEFLHNYRFYPYMAYQTLAHFFEHCADFTTGKEEEYAQDAVADKMCRFDKESNTPIDGIVTDHIFLMQQQKLIGTLSMTIMPRPKGGYDIYFYDEIVDYFSLLTQEGEKLYVYQRINKCMELNKLLKQDGRWKDRAKIEAEINQLKAEIEVKVGKHRKLLLQKLFNAACQHLDEKLSNFSTLVTKKQVHGFIRTAAGRVQMYEELGCSHNNNSSYVIHGPATPALGLLNNFVKQTLAKQKHLQASPPVSISSFLLTTFPPSPPRPQVKTSIKPLEPQAKASAKPIRPKNSDLVVIRPRAKQPARTMMSPRWTTSRSQTQYKISDVMLIKPSYPRETDKTHLSESYTRKKKRR